ncbi:hypothetical protein NPIL_536931, partial [Nephila pilipes]
MKQRGVLDEDEYDVLCFDERGMDEYSDHETDSHIDDEFFPAKYRRHFSVREQLIFDKMLEPYRGRSCPI